jgi:hypothetical protein
MEDYIYILLGVAWILYAIYRANQKKKAKEAESQDTAEPVGDGNFEMKSMIDELLGNDSIAQPETAQTNDLYQSKAGVTDYDKYRKGHDIQTDYKLDSVPEEEGVSSISSYQYEDKSLEVTDNEVNDELLKHIHVDFDLRKAVIYAEILNRPYD